MRLYGLGLDTVYRLGLASNPNPIPNPNPTPAPNPNPTPNPSPTPNTDRDPNLYRPKDDEERRRRDARNAELQQLAIHNFGTLPPP